MSLDDLDCRILNLIQTKFPVTPRPYLEIASSLSLTEEEVIKRIARLKEAKIIKHIRGVFDYQRLGYQGVLCAAAVAEKDLTETASLINAYPGVTHNYQRDHSFNLWFTLLTSSQEKSLAILQEIRELKTVKELLILPARKLFKIKVDFHFQEAEE